MASPGMQFTDRGRKALEDAMALSQQYAHSQIMPIHLAVALLDPLPDESKDQQQTFNASHGAASSSFFRQVVERAHGDPQLFDRALKKSLVRLPSQDPPPDQPGMSPAFSKILRLANEMQKTQKDSYIAVDHLISALAQDDNIKKCMAEAKIGRASCRERVF